MFWPEIGRILCVTAIQLRTTRPWFLAADLLQESSDVLDNRKKDWSQDGSFFGLIRFPSNLTVIRKDRLVSEQAAPWVVSESVRCVLYLSWVSV